MKKINRYFGMAIFIIGSVLFNGCSGAHGDKTDAIATSTIAQAGTLYSNFTLKGNSNSKMYHSEPIGEVFPGENVKILESNHWSKYKVLLEDGRMGWIEASSLSPSKRTFIKYGVSSSNRHLSADRGYVGSARKIVKEIDKKTAVIRLEEWKDVKQNGYTIDWTKVRTDDGVEGWLMSEYLYQVPQEKVRFVKRKHWQYSMDGFIDRWVGQPVIDFANKFSEPSGVKVGLKGQTWYFNNIVLFKKHKKLYGIRVQVTEGIITGMDAARKKGRWVSYMPLSSTLQMDWLANYIGNWNAVFEKGVDRGEAAFDLTNYLPGWLVVIIGLLIILAMVFLVLRIPYYFLNKYLYKKSLNRKWYNRRVLTLAIVKSLIVGYVYYIIMVVNVYPFTDYFIVTSLFCLGMLLGNINKWRNDLDYKRCDAANCHQWTGEDNGTEYLGGSRVTQKVTYSNGGLKTNTQTMRRLRDHRICSVCGNEWSILRTEVIGGLKV